MFLFHSANPVAKVLMSVRNITQAMAHIAAIADVPITEALSASVGGGVKGGGTVSAETQIQINLRLYFTPRFDLYHYVRI